MTPERPRHFGREATTLFFDPDAEPLAELKDGERITVATGEDSSESRVLDVDTIVLCTGQESVRDLIEPLEALGKPVHVIGGADVAAELDAKRAIKQATELAARL